MTWNTGVVCRDNLEFAPGNVDVIVADATKLDINLNIIVSKLIALDSVRL